jgi:hypothetical protein
VLFKLVAARKSSLPLVLRIVRLEGNLMRTPKPNGKGKPFKPGPSWLEREYLNYLKWYEEVMSSKRRRKDRSPINIGN